MQIDKLEKSYLQQMRSAALQHVVVWLVRKSKLVETEKS